MPVRRKLEKIIGVPDSKGPSVNVRGAKLLRLKPILQQMREQHQSNRAILPRLETCCTMYLAHVQAVTCRERPATICMVPVGYPQPVYTKILAKPSLGFTSNCAYRRRTVRSWASYARVFAPVENVWRSLMNMLMSLENKEGKIRDISL